MSCAKDEEVHGTNGSTSAEETRTTNGLKRVGSSSNSFEFDEEEQNFSSTMASQPSKKFTKVQSCYAIYRKAAGPSSKLTAERGQMQDFKHELHYILTTFYDEKATQNLKSLSLTQLTKKAISPQFRNFLRTQNMQMDRLFGVLSELAPNSPVISLSSACLLYLLARDQKSVPISENCFRLVSELLKQDSQKAKEQEDYRKHIDTIWSILKDWLTMCERAASKSIQFDVTVDSLSPAYLALEALAFMATREHNQFFKASLLNSGCLTSVIAKLDKVVLELVHSPTADTAIRLKVVERCFRILENAAAFDKKNQVFLIQHRNNLLIFSSAKFLNFASKYFDACPSSSTAEQDGIQIFECICLLCRMLMNVSHENENASLKIGQVAGFLGNCLTLLACHSKNAPKDKFFDVCCMMYGLLVNLLEHCAANRRKFISLKANLSDESNGESTAEMASIEILTKLFIKHDSAAKTIDEELDNDLVAEEPMGEEDEGEQGTEEGGGMTRNGGGTNGKGGKGAEHSMSEDEIIAAIQSAMNKASAHMEDSMIASYCALVMAILVGSDEKLASQVRALLPNGEMRPMIEQLERFLEFMQLTKKLKETTVKNIERLIKSFELATTATSNTI